MARGSDVALLAVLVALAASEDRHRPRPLSWLANKGVGAVDLDELLQGVDVDALVRRIDLDAVLAEVDIQALLQRVDLNALLADVDLNTLLADVDLNALLDRVDPNPLLDRVEPNRLLDRVDADRLLDRVDVDRIMDRVDVQGLVDRAGIADIVAESTGAVAGSVLDVARRQMVALDVVVERPIYQFIGRDPRARPPGPPQLLAAQPLIFEGRGQVSGRYAGPVSRAAAFTLDAFIAFWVFTLGSAGLAWVGASLGVHLSDSMNGPYVGIGLFVVWCFAYWWIGLALTGRTIGKGIVGLRVLQHDGDPITSWEAAVRTFVLPVSFVTFALGVVVVLISPRRRTLHDAVAKTCEVYDWGDRPAELPAPITAWIAKRAGVAVDESTTIGPASE